jgi:DNA-binding NarL/FixJ family response regulator
VLEIFIPELKEGARPGPTTVGNQDVYRAELSGNALSGIRYCAGIAHIERHGDASTPGCVANFGSSFLETVHVASRDRHLCPFCSQRSSAGQADPSRAARYPGHLSFEFQIHVPSTIYALLMPADHAALRVVFAEDNYLVREGTSALLREVDSVDLVEIVEDHPSLMKAVEEHAPDAVLTDIRMPPTNRSEGIDAAKEIRAQHPEIGVVVLSQYSEEEYAYELLKDGAEGLGYLLKERVGDVDELVRALREVSAGGSVLDPKVVEGLIARKRKVEDSPLGRLTDREREVLENMAQGKNNAAIAGSMFLSERAVEKHINSLFHKLDLSEEPAVHRRVMAVLAFLREERGAR